MKNYLILFILLFASFKVEAQEKVTFKYNYVSIIIFENDEVGSVIEKVRSETDIIILSSEQKIILRFRNTNQEFIYYITDLAKDEGEYIEFLCVDDKGFSYIIRFYDKKTILVSDSTIFEYTQ